LGLESEKATLYPLVFWFGSFYYVPEGPRDESVQMKGAIGKAQITHINLHGKIGETKRFDRMLSMGEKDRDDRLYRKIQISLNPAPNLLRERGRLCIGGGGKGNYKNPELCSREGTNGHESQIRPPPRG